ncbi:MAG: AAA family ATPase [Gemmatimonadaceae bacterium]
MDAAENLPEPLRKLAALVTLPPPSRADYQALIKRVVQHLHQRINVRTELTADDLERLIAALQGLTLVEAEHVLTRVIVDDGVLNAQDIAQVVAAKYADMKAVGLLEFCPVDVTLDDIADLKSLKAWLATRRAVVSAPGRAAAAGLPFPRGMLLVGVPGCGKSMCAKAVAADWKMPLLRLDTSGIYDKFVGESEKRFLSAIHAAERAAPAVLWIDEIEKAFAGSSDNDGGVSTRILGTFLSWLQERRGDVFVVATANDVGRLPPELVRKGRFDEIFFVDLPDAEVRESIFKLHLQRRKQSIEAFDMPALSRAADGFSGAEIEQVVVSALYRVFAAGGTLRMEDLTAEIARTRPLSATMQERIQALRDWSTGRTASAH